MEDEIPLIERSEESPKNIKSRTRPIQHTNPSFSKGDNLAVHEVQSKDTLQSLSLNYGCSITEIKQHNNLFSDVDLHTKTVLSIPDRKQVAIGKLIDIPDDRKNDSETSSTGDPDTAAKALLERIGKIDLSTKTLMTQVSSIGTLKTDEEVHQENDKKLSEFLGNLPPVAVLPDIKRFQKENENRQWCCLGLCVVVTLIGFPLLMYYFLSHHQHVHLTNP